MNSKSFYVYILASKKGGTLYTGITSDLRTRVLQHKSELFDSFTKRYQIRNLVYLRKREALKVPLLEKNVSKLGSVNGKSIS